MSIEEVYIDPKMAGCPFNEINISKLLPYFLDDPEVTEENVTVCFLNIFQTLFMNE